MQHQTPFEQDLLTLRPELHRFARGLTGDPTAAEDLVQETLTRALQHRAKFKSGTNLRAWTFTILRNFHHSQWHKDKRSIQQGDWFEDSLMSLPQQEASMLLGEVFDEICALSDCQRDALLLVGVEGCSYDEAASFANCPVGTMKSRVSRAREALQSTLKRQVKKSHSAGFISAGSVLDLTNALIPALHPASR